MAGARCRVVQYVCWSCCPLDGRRPAVSLDLRQAYCNIDFSVAGKMKKENMFFFEKKNQKTFVCLVTRQMPQ
jgi:hypothetical protein